MSDLVKRLRRAWDGTPGGGALEEEAADQLEHYKAFVEKVRGLSQRAAMVPAFDLDQALAELDAIK